MDQNSPPPTNSQTYSRDYSAYSLPSQTPISSRYPPGYRPHTQNLHSTPNYVPQSGHQYDEYKETIPISSSMNRQIVYQPSYTLERSYSRNQSTAIPTPSIPKLVSSPSIQYPNSTPSPQHRNSYPYNRVPEDQPVGPALSTYPSQTYEHYRDIPFNERQPPSPNIDMEKETLRNVEFKYLRLIQEILFLVTKYSSRTKGNTQNTELISLTNELLNAVQRHTAEPLEKTSTFQAFTFTYKFP
jgi:hypothetical protein